MTDNTPAPVPAATYRGPDLKSLERLVGTWTLSGGAQGTVTYKWIDGGFFLIQHLHLEQSGEEITGIEIIAHERPFGA